MPPKPNIEDLREDKDLEGLMTALRYPGSSTVRAQAAVALGQLNNSVAVECLIRSSQLDPAAEVQTAARQALQEMFGGNAQNVIRAYPIYPDEAPWIIGTSDNAAEDDVEYEEDESEDGEDDIGEKDPITGDEVEGGWTADDLGALVTILRSERDPRLRLRAARALGHLGATNIHAVEALAATALWGEKPSIRAAALQALVNIYGDEETDRLLDTFREMQTLQADPQDMLEADWGGEMIQVEPATGSAAELPRQFQALPQPIPYSHHEPVMREEGTGHLKLVIWIGITLLVILGLGVVFSYSK